MLTLAVETSCDDTCAAVLEDDACVRANVIASQAETHSRYGGVVPELASRQHVDNIDRVVRQALDAAGVGLADLELVAVTQGPGLVGSLLVGLAYAKSLAYALELPLVGVNHLEGHLMSPLLQATPPAFPFIGLVVSGGHTSLYLVRGWHDYRLLGRTIDDAAGEAFDKVAKMLGLGYPGGPLIERQAAEGDPRAIKFPRALLGADSLDFSFSGLKTAVRTYIEKNRGDLPARLPDIAASFQEAVCDVLSRKALLAAARHGVDAIALAGGVSCNRELRRYLGAAAAARGLRLHLAPPVFCTDNAAMIALAGYRRYRRGERADWRLNAVSRLSL